MPKDYEELEKALDVVEEYPEVWTPKVGDKLIGEVVAVREPNTRVGQRRVYEIQDKNGKKYSVWETKVISSEFSNRGITVGSKVGIKYLGIPKGKRYHSFKVVKLDDAWKRR